MSASNEDINLTIISNGQTAYYSSVKGIGHILWDIRFGLFSEEKPNPFTVLKFTKNTDWEDCIEVLDRPLDNPVYGIITVDFDNKVIIDSNGYGLFNQMFIQWFAQSVLKPSSKGVMIPKKSLDEHLKNGRLSIYGGNNVLFPKNIKDMQVMLSSWGWTNQYSIPEFIRENHYDFVTLEIPIGWHHQDE